MNLRIIPIEEKHAEGFHACLDYVAKERKYLVFQEAPPLESTLGFVKENVETGQVQLVVMDEEKVVGWCDILKPKSVAFAHVGAVGIGLLPGYRGKGCGEEAFGRSHQKGVFIRNREGRVDGLRFEQECHQLVPRDWIC